MFYNTTNETGTSLKASILAAASQDQIILNLFNESREELTPFEVQERALPYAPITSVRRSLTNLTASSILVKCSHKKKGKYLANNHTWKLNEGKVLA